MLMSDIHSNIGINDMKKNELMTYARTQKHYIFSAEEAKRVFKNSTPKTVQNQLQEYSKRNELLRLKNGLYEIRYPEGGPDIPDLYLANKIYEPSYVSLETALSFYSMIPDVAAEVTSVTTKHSRCFKNAEGSFSYFTCRREAFNGYTLLGIEGFKVLIAEKEKALADFMYFKMRRGDRVSLETDRLDDVLLKSLNWKKALAYGAVFGAVTLKRLKQLKGELL